MSERGAEGQLAARQAASHPEPIRPQARESGRVSAPRSYAPAQDNYWAFMFAVIFGLFIAYVAGKKQLGDWIEILIPAPAKAPKFTGADQAPGGPDTGSKTPLDKIAPNVPGAAPPGQQFGQPGYGMGNEMWNAFKKYFGF
jgi:hypothetical protein